MRGSTKTTKRMGKENTYIKMGLSKMGGGKMGSFNIEVVKCNSNEFEQNKYNIHNL